MNILSFFSTIIFSLVLFQSFYVLLLKPKKKSNLLFFFMGLCLAAWLLASAFCYSAPSREFIETFVRATSFSYIFLHAFTLHFIFHYTRKSSPYPLFLLIIYGISAGFWIISLNQGIVFEDFYRANDYWQALPNYGSPVFFLFLLHIHSYYTACYILLIKAIRRSKKRREKIQYRIILFSLLSTVILYNIEPFVLPLLFDYPQFIISANFGIIWSTGIWISILEFGFLKINPQFLSEEILANIKDAIILLNPDFTITFVNRKASKLLGIKKDWETWVNRDFLSFVVDQGNIRKIKEEFTNGGQRDHHLRFHIKTDQKPLLLDAVIIKVRDRFRDSLGFLVIANEVERLAEHLKEYKLTPREITVAEYIISGYPNKEIAFLLELSERTIKAHISNIYSKLAVTSKGELLTLLNNFPPPREKWQGWKKRKTPAESLTNEG